MKKNKGLFLYGLCICLVGAAFCGIQFYQEIKPRIEAEQQYRSIRDSVFKAKAPLLAGEALLAEEASSVGEEEAPDFAVLWEMNPDVRGWIRIPGTTVDYPVVQGEDNDYYLDHTFDGRKSIIGSIFMDSENQPDFQDDVTILYGHHIRGGRMFSPLSGYKKQSFYNTHTTAYWYTPNQNWEVEWFAGQILDGQTSYFTRSFANKEEKKKWMDQVKKTSFFNSDVTPTAENRILALCTCTYEYGDARLVIYGRLKELTGKLGGYK